MTAPLIHLGYPKAGSTWLQNRLFSDPDSGFVTPWGSTPSLTIEHLLVTDTFRFDERLEKYRSDYCNGLELAESNRLVPVISYEHLLLDQMRGKNVIRESVRRLKLLFPSAKILLIIREQNAMILSSYTEHLRRGHTTAIDRFIGTAKFRRLGFGPVCDLDTFCYHNPIAFLRDAFGPDSVLVLPLEQISTSLFTDQIRSFAGCTCEFNPEPYIGKKVRSMRKSDFVLLRHLNKIGHSRYNNYTADSLFRKVSYAFNGAISPFIPNFIYNQRKSALKDVIKSHTKGYFEESNKITSELIATDLSNLGYALP